VFVRKRRDVTDSERGKGVVRERIDVTYSASGIGVVRERLDVTNSGRVKECFGRDVMLQTVEAERGH